MTSVDVHGWPLCPSDLFGVTICPYAENLSPRNGTNTLPASSPMVYQNPCETLHNLRSGDVIEVRHRGETYRLEVSEVNVETDKPDIYGSQYHVLVRGKTTEYRLFSNGDHGSTVTIEYDIANNSNSPIWKCLGTIDQISVSRSDTQ